MSLFKKFVPDLYVSNIYQINIEMLKKNGIEGILTDLDNTLVRWDQSDSTDEIVRWFQQLNNEGIKTVIISNNNEMRVRGFVGEMNIPFIHKARKPLGRGFVDGLKTLQLSANKVAVIGDQVLTDVLGGNRQGMYTILVDPIGDKEYITTKINRRIERKIVRYLYRKGLISWVR